MLTEARGEIVLKTAINIQGKLQPDCQYQLNWCKQTYSSVPQGREMLIQ